MNLGINSAPSNRATSLFTIAAMLWLLMLLTACNQPITQYPLPSPEEIAAEESLQHQLISSVAAKGGAPRPWRRNKMSGKRFDRVADRVEKAGAEICQELGLPQQGMRCYFYFQTKRGDDINAYADGERIFVLSGMRRFLESDDELALLLGHELAHNMMGHIPARQNNALVGLLVGAALEGVAASGGYNLPGTMEDSAALGSLTFSHEFEKEADYVGLYIASRAGYNTEKAIRMWQRLSVEDPEGLYGSITHPSNPERAAVLKKTIQEITSKRKESQPLLPSIKPAP